jgi:hypothetical protein
MAGCGGLHCAGCAGGAAAPVVPLAAVFGLAWIAEHLIEVAIVSAVCGALAVAAVVALMKWTDLRDARRAVTWRLLHARSETVQAVTQSGTSVPLTSAERPALGFRDLHLHLDGPAAEQAQVIRQALNGRTNQS